jgi:succinate dehydrogenase/fumarate reductase flavoprotein subunit
VRDNDASNIETEIGMSSRYDVIVIGAGPAGYISAISASQNGLMVA